MQQKWFSVAFVALLCLGGCTPTSQSITTTPVELVPLITVLPTATPVHTRTTEETPPAPHDPVFLHNEQTALNLEAQSVVLLDADTGTVLYEENAYQQMYPASTTKIMTGLLALEYFHPDELLLVGEEANLTWVSDRLDAQKAGLYYGQQLTMKELLYGLLLASGSDAAFTIAVNVARRATGDDFLDDEQAIAFFSTLMNQHADAIGANETNFTNPDGIQDPKHNTTAYDLALIAKDAMQDPLFREIVAAAVFRTGENVTESGRIRSRTWENTNRLIQPTDPHYYAPANGIKTGTTPEAGHCLVSSAIVRDHLVIAVVLGSTEEGVWSDSVTLLEYAKEDAR